jgi:putative Mg2+ transporter-C (MgtC) family protein
MVADLNVEVVVKLLLATVLGGLVGLEREFRNKPAGLRTNMLICLGATLFTVLSQEIAGRLDGDHTRIASQVIPGIGFIGAGAIIREGASVQGLTTAATIFVVASVGMALGGGMYATAVFTALITVVALAALGSIEGRIGMK